MTILDKVYFQEKNITRDKEGYVIMVKRPIHQRYIIILTVYVPNNRTSKCIKQNLIEL